MSEGRATLARRERSGLVETFRRIGPDAPTLCEGWTTRDLAAHLVVREGRPDAAAGILVSALAPRLEELRVREAERPWEELLDRIEAGAPWYSPLRYADAVANAAEYLVHHEDVLRAADDWSPREFSEADLGRIWSLATTVAKASLRKAPARIELRTPPGIRPDGAGPVSTGARITPAVTVSAEPVELLLWAFGREAVRVDVSGERSAVEAVTRMPRGL